MASLWYRGLRKIRRTCLNQTTLLRRPFRVGIVGLGNIGTDHLYAYRELAAADVVAICDTSPHALARGLDRHPTARAYRDLRQMLRERRPNVLSVCTWPGSHADIVIAAATHGVRGILCEKPLALRRRDVARMTAVCREHGTKLAVGHQWRFHSLLSKARELIGAGGVGRVSHVSGFIAGSLGNNGSHLVDAVRYVLSGASVKAVSCRCIGDFGRNEQGFLIEDGAETRLRLGGNISCELRTGTLAPDFFGLRVEGSAGFVEFDTRELRNQQGVVHVPNAGDFRQRQFQEFLRWIAGKQSDYRADGTSGAVAAEVISACYLSSKNGKAITLPLTEVPDDVPETINRELPYEQTKSHEREPHTCARLAVDGGQRALPAWPDMRPAVGFEEVKNLTVTLATRRWNRTDGRFVPSLEREFEQLYSCPRAVASSSGTAAIHVALGALGIGPGDEVVTTPLSDMGTVLPILACGATPVFADVDAVTGNLTADSIASRLSDKTRAVIVVHLFGRPAQMDGLNGIADLVRTHGAALIEDCAQAHLAEHNGKLAGTFGDFGCFSFQQSKQIACGDGGMTLVNQNENIDRAILFADKGWDRQGERSHVQFGLNYRMTEFQGAVALAQLHRAPRNIARMRHAAEELLASLADLPGLRFPARMNQRPSWWKFHFLLDKNCFGSVTSEFAGLLSTEGVPASCGYLPRPLFDEAVFAAKSYGTECTVPKEADKPRATAASLAGYPGLAEFFDCSVVIPWTFRLTKKDIRRIATAVRKVHASIGTKDIFTSSPTRLSVRNTSIAAG